MRGEDRKAVLGSVGALTLVTSAQAADSGPITHYEGRLQAVTAVSRSDAWAVGQGTAKALYALRWRAGGWVRVSVPHPGTASNLLNGVDAVSASDVWAVGAYYDNHVGKTLIARWNGSRWTRVPSPSFGATSSYGSVLQGVSASSSQDAWAVGWYTKPGAVAEFQSLILRWNGTRWTRVSGPEPRNSSLSGVSSISSSDAWAVGTYTPAGKGGAAALVLHWNGKHWARARIPLPRGANTALNGVTADSASDVWAVGYYGAGGMTKPLLLHWNGTAWQRLAAPAIDGKSNLEAVAAVNSTSAWAVGYRFRGNARKNLILRWNGTRWRTVSTPQPGAQEGNFLAGVAAQRHDAWAVGYYLSPPPDIATFRLLLHWNGRTWSGS